MGFSQFTKRSSFAAMATAGLATLGMSLDLGVDGKGDAGSVGSQVQLIGGLGTGTIQMPTISQTGILVALGQSENGAAYALDAELWSNVPGLFDPLHRVAMGTLSGDFFQAPSGSDSPFTGSVEGYWRMERSLVGSYRAVIYTSASRGGREIVGQLQGSFRVSVAADGDAVPGPVVDPTKGDASKAFRANLRKPGNLADDITDPEGALDSDIPMRKRSAGGSGSYPGWEVPRTPFAPSRPFGPNRTGKLGDLSGDITDPEGAIDSDVQTRKKPGTVTGGTVGPEPDFGPEVTKNDDNGLETDYARARPVDFADDKSGRPDGGGQDWGAGVSGKLIDEALFSGATKLIFKLVD